MIYKFKSKAAADLVMLGEGGDQLLRILGKEPAAQGIIEPGAMASGMAALQAAVEQDEQQAQGVRRKGVSLRQRVWPMLEMMKRAREAGEPIVWGV